ncbi:MAG: selenium binding protein [Tenericutes bacterium]|nr:selenium binding protein [Mycoplasmatota bacterium]
MYEEYSKQSLPNRKYRELLGSSLCVFNSNNAFIIENILRIENDKYNWSDLIDKTSGNLVPIVEKTISKVTKNNVISTMFCDLVNTRNRIIHSFQITDEVGNQLLATKERNGTQYRITEEELFIFIKKNELLSSELHKFRGH